jgi:hypothetical protein
MKKLNQLLFGILILGLTFSCQAPKEENKSVEKLDGAIEQEIKESTATIVTQENFPQAYTSMRFGAIINKAGGVNKFFEMPVPSSIPEEQFVVRMNRDTFYSSAVIDMSSGEVYVTIPETDQYVTTQIVDENHETQLMIYGSGRHKLTAKTDHAFVIVRALEDAARRNLLIEAGSAKPYVVKEYEMESFHAVDKAGNLDFSDGYDQAKAFGNKESGQTTYMNYVGAAGGWGGAMVEDNIYQTSTYFDAEGCYEMTFVDPEAEYFWSATVYNEDGRMFNDVANVSSEMNPTKNADGTYTVRFGCDGQPNNIPIREGNKTGKFNVLIRHYGPSEEVSQDKDGYNATKFIKRVKNPGNPKSEQDSTIKIRTSSCSCGKLSVSYEGPDPERITMCHCNSCQLRTGTMFSVQARFPRNKVKIEGESTKWTFPSKSGKQVEYPSCDSGGATYHFCPVCGSTVYWDITTAPDFVGLAIGNLTDPTFPPPKISGFEDYGHSWSMKAADLPIKRLGLAE